MAVITLRVIDGPDRGKVFENLATPVSVGREEGNIVRLHDERVSRFHLKIQEDQGKIVLTDLQSTNGTYVNGERVQLWILRPGDLIMIGRSMLLFGSRAEIAQRLAALRGVDLSQAVPVDDEQDLQEVSPSVALEAEFYWGDEPDAYNTLHLLLPPDLPTGLSPSQAAQLAELLQYLQLRLRRLIRTVRPEPQSERVTLQQRQWQNLLDMYEQLGQYIRQVGEPEM